MNVAGFAKVESLLIATIMDETIYYFHIEIIKKV